MTNPKILKTGDTILPENSPIVEREDVPFGPPPEEYLYRCSQSIIYTASGRVSAQVMRRDRPSFSDEDQMNGTDDEIAASFKGCISYYGSYEMDENGGFPQCAASAMLTIKILNIPSSNCLHHFGHIVITFGGVQQMDMVGTQAWISTEYLVGYSLSQLV